jgi:hypothetical protein
MTKKIKIIILMLLVLPSMFSCKKFLDIDPLFTQDAENFFETPNDYQRALNWCL